MNMEKAKAAGLAAVYRMGPLMRPGVRLSEMDFTIVYCPYIPLYTTEVFNLSTAQKREAVMAALKSFRCDKTGR